jgi:putative transposase
LINPEDKELSVSKQCKLVGISRSAYYDSQNRGPDAESVLVDRDFELVRIVDGIFTDLPFYGSRKMVHEILRRHGLVVNRKRIQRIMRKLGLEAIVPWRSTSIPHPEHKKYPYLLRGVKITRPNHVWSTDITYVRTRNGYCYMAAIVDWYSRKVLSWKMSNTMDSSFCVDALEEAFAHYGSPDIFNSDQGSQFTSAPFIGALLERNVRISMDGKGRALDNVFIERFWRSLKYEDIYVKGYETLKDAKTGIGAYVEFYNSERFHQNIGYRTPDDLYFERTTVKATA